MVAMFTMDAVFAMLTGVCNDRGMSSPVPYRPPDLGHPRHGKRAVPQVDKSRPWLALKPGETQTQWQRRINHSCWRCGHFEEDTAALDEHEAEHGLAARSDSTSSGSDND